MRHHFPDLAKLLVVHVGRSDDLSTAEYIERIESKPRFISIDGSHMARDVLFDLNLAAEITSEAGIVAVDDFLNPMTLGVNEATARFMLDGNKDRLSPFCFCANKLYSVPTGLQICICARSRAVHSVPCKLS